jgi:hypothetical protein
LRKGFLLFDNFFVPLSTRKPNRNRNLIFTSNYFITIYEYLINFKKKFPILMQDILQRFICTSNLLFQQKNKKPHQIIKRVFL